MLLKTLHIFIRIYILISSHQYRFNPVYLPPNFKRHSNHWLIKSWKAKDNRLVDLYSQLEYFNYVLLEANPKVQLLCEQPLHINCIHNGARLNYVFDLWVKWSDGQEELIEVKPYEELLPSVNGSLEPKKWGLIKSWCDKNGYDCRFITEREILSNRVILSNARQILRYNPTYLDLSFRNDIFEKIPIGITVQLKDLLSLYSHIPLEIIMSTVVYMIINDDLKSDLDVSLFTPETLLSGVKHET